MNLEEFVKNLSELGGISEAGTSGFKVVYSGFEIIIGIDQKEDWIQIKYSFLGEVGFKRESLPEDLTPIWEEIWKKYQEYLELFRRIHAILL